MNIGFDRMIDIVGFSAATDLRRITLEIYDRARDHAAERGIIIADTKFEFGTIDGEITLIDEVLTPDSSRFWPADEYAPGHGQPSFDKQYVRDWLEASGWDKASPPPSLPAEVIEGTSTALHPGIRTDHGTHLRPRRHERWGDLDMGQRSPNNARYQKHTKPEGKTRRSAASAKPKRDAGGSATSSSKSSSKKGGSAREQLRRAR